MILADASIAFDENFLVKIMNCFSSHKLLIFFLIKNEDFQRVFIHINITFIYFLLLLTCILQTCEIIVSIDILG